MARPWLRILMVQGSNPTDAQKFFSIISFQIERLRDSIDGYCENDQIGLGRPPQEAQTSKSSQLNKTSSEPTYLYITLEKTMCITFTFIQTI